MKTKAKNERTFNSILIAGIGIACFYWVCESFMFFFMDPEANFIQHLLGPDMFETWTRLLVLCLFAIFGSHIQYTVNKERAADEALRLSEEKHRSILENIEEGYFETDLLGNITFLNPPLCRILGYHAEELKGINTQRFTTDSAAVLAEAHLNKVMRTGEPAVVPDYDVIQKDGAKKELELSISLIRDGLERPSGFRYVVRDVSERKQSEEERKKLEAQLQQAQKMEAIGTLAGGIAHDFNNILMGIQGNASLLELKLDPDFPGREKIKNIEKYVESGTELSKQLLGFARRGKYIVKASDINDIIAKTSSMFARTKKEIRMRTQLSEQVWTVEVDRGQIEQALLNLYINAWQAMPDGGDLYLMTENITLDEAYTRPYVVPPGRYVKVTVADTGAGIDKKDIGRVFEPFFTTKEMGRGIGLGLASVYGIIKGHGGHINVYSEKGHGTTFTFYLPASSREVASEAPKAVEAIRTGRETILLVDDEAGIRKVLGISLADSGYHVTTAGNGEEALTLFRALAPAIVLTDIKMPDMDGIELLRRIKAEKPDTEVIMFTGHGDMELAIKSLKYEATDFVTKPINDEILEIALKRARERIAMRRQLRDYTENLERLVEEKARRLIEAERMAAVGQTVAELSHTIKNIANALKGSIYVLGKGIGLDEKEYLHQGWRMVEKNVKKIKNLSLDLLNYGRYAEPVFSRCDPNAPAAEVVRLMQSKAVEQGVLLTAELAADLEPLAMDPDGIHRCLLNLVGNAFDACCDNAAGGRDMRIVVSTRPLAGGGVAYRVADNGCGMDEAVKRRLFQSFFSTKSAKGNGIGLMMTRRIVDRHGGTITVESTRGQGSTFTIELPRGSQGASPEKRNAV